MWIRYTGVEKPYRDERGRELQTIEGLRNLPGRDEFFGGGRVMPDLSGIKLKRRIERGLYLYVEVDAPYELRATRAVLTVIEVKRGYKERAVVMLQSSDFAPVVMTDAEIGLCGIVARDNQATIEATVNGG